MKEFWLTYGIFLAKCLTTVCAVLFLISSVLSLINRYRVPQRQFEIINLNKRYQELRSNMLEAVLDKAAYKRYQKREEDAEKGKKTVDKDREARPHLFVLKFTGDLKASAVENLREEITALITIATPKDEVLVILESSGGTVNGYGLAASQLTRLKSRNIQVTVAIDEVAASGGYLMASVANKILAAPFAVVGSIGVVASLPNFNRFLKKHDIDFEQLTAGKYKRTLSLFGPNTAEGRKKLQEELEETHRLFKEFIKINRPNLDVEKLATGETWYGADAIELKLVDRIITSDDYLIEKCSDHELFMVSYYTKPDLLTRLSNAVQRGTAKLLDNFWYR